MYKHIRDKSLRLTVLREACARIARWHINSKLREHNESTTGITDDTVVEVIAQAFNTIATPSSDFWVSFIPQNLTDWFNFTLSTFDMDKLNPSAIGLAEIFSRIQQLTGICLTKDAADTIKSVYHFKFCAADIGTIGARVKHTNAVFYSKGCNTLKHRNYN